MAQVTLQINGYGYVLGCADGEEDHLHALAVDLDRRIDEIKVATGPSGEARLLLMAALMISDELHDFRQQHDPVAPPAGAKADPKIGRRLRGIAKRAEAIADSAEAPPLAGLPETAAPEKSKPEKSELAKSEPGKSLGEKPSPEISASETPSSDASRPIVVAATDDQS